MSFFRSFDTPGSKKRSKNDTMKDSTPWQKKYTEYPPPLRVPQGKKHVFAHNFSSPNTPVGGQAKENQAKCKGISKVENIIRI